MTRNDGMKSFGGRVECQCGEIVDHRRDGAHGLRPQQAVGVRDDADANYWAVQR
jgi:hypothetical protein